MLEPSYEKNGFITVFNVVLYEPEIPPNTGNIIRLCANTGCQLHLIQPLGFELSDKQLKRAGLDYRTRESIKLYDTLDEYLKTARRHPYYCTSKGTQPYDKVAYQPGDSLVFGPETRGLPMALLAAQTPETLLRLPMTPGNRSLNLNNAVAVCVYEAWRQNGFAGSLS